VEDTVYDQAERRYLELSKKLKKPATATFDRNNPDEDSEGMIQLDFTRPSVLCVLKKYGKPGLFSVRRGSGAGIEWSEEMLGYLD
jgi:hypothetical protein